MQTIQQTFNSVSYKVEEPLILENGQILRDLRIHYTTHGELNESKTNVVWVFHALTANSDPIGWWPGVVGEGTFIDPDKDFIICANMLGSCYGSTEPTSYDFPLLTIGDLVRAHKELKDHLGIRKVKIGIGGSMGGQQLLEWAVQEPDLFENMVLLATNAKHSAWGIAFNEAQRMALRLDGQKGIEAARAIAMLSYRNYITYEHSQTDNDHRLNDYSASSYQNYQGQKLAKRFSPISYYYLSKAMDSHDVGRYFQSSESALNRIRSKTIVIGLDTDLLFPISDQQFIAEHIPNASLHVITSNYGHDGFLTEAKEITKILIKELT
ncbi:MAG: homoserine O-acetyltransferase [Bacteroidota bacterium]